MQQMEFDVIVAGGGTAGCIAGLAAARNGAKTLIVEKNRCLGGQFTSGMQGAWVGFSDKRNRCVGGMTWELRNILKDMGAIVDKDPDKDVCYLYDTEVAKIVLDDLAAKEPNLTTWLNTQIIDVLQDGDTVTGLVVVSEMNIIEVRAKVVIDSTGDAGVCAKAGATYEIRPDKEIQPMSLIGKMAGVDMDKVAKYYEEHPPVMDTMMPPAWHDFKSFPGLMHFGLKDELKDVDLPADKEPDMTAWNALVDKIKHPSKKIEIALVGKYTELPDAYKSICESFIHAGAVNDCKVKLRYVNSEKVTGETAASLLGKMSGILVAPGFGNRGIEGKIEAVRFARENGIPFLGICLGMQCAVIEFARNVLGLPDANSSEMEQATAHPVIDLMEEQKGVTAKGGTMRLGAYPCTLKKGSKVAAAYGKLNISERHRHRYEFNNDYLEQFEAAGMKAVGVNPDTNLVEAVEIENHPWFVGVQYHPEYKSTVLSPSPLFVAFVRAALEYAGKK